MELWIPVGMGIGISLLIFITSKDKYRLQFTNQ
jgi:hypothetical protein